jgi:hypothetical protein
MVVEPAVGSLSGEVGEVTSSAPGTGVAGGATSLSKCGEMNVNELVAERTFLLAALHR